MDSLTPLGRKIFLDRYALKDIERKTLAEGDDVLVITNKETGQREVGHVSNLYPEFGQAMISFDEDTYGMYSIEDIDKPLETTPQEMIARVARAVASNEKAFDVWYHEFISIMQDWKFIPAGRILAAAGSPGLTYYNCYVLPSPQDSRDGIFDRLKQMAEIMSRGGGVGVNISSLRPKKAYVKGVNGRSSGAVSWGSLYSTVTGLIEQGGSRRGACMIIMNDWHPDIEEFINSKRTAGKITNANISVAVSNQFMTAVELDLNWDLVFPDTTYPNYTELWDGDLDKWTSAERPIKVHKTIRARELWDQITLSAWESAEPGIWFNQTTKLYSNSYYHSPLLCTNPCGEMPLPAWGVCNLGAINLSKFYHEVEQVDWSELARVVKIAIRFLDNVIDVTPYFFDENREQQLKERRIGLNTMGLAELLIKNQIRYGSPESLDFIDVLYRFIATTAYTASIELAMEKGHFPAFAAELFLKSGYAQNLPASVRAGISRYGLRNVTLLTQAPNGSIGTMLNTSTGIEPFFSFEWTRKSRLGVHTEYMQVAQDWLEWHKGEALPDYFVTAQQLTPEEHVQVQATIQRWIDSAISKTCNLPANYTVEQVKKIYELMYHTGCKGGTIYRDHSRSDQVLYDKAVDPVNACPECKSENYVNQDGCTTCADCGYALCKV